MAVMHLLVEFHGEAAHAAMMPWKGRSALDAAELMNIGVQYLREHITSDCSLHYVYRDGGVADSIPFKAAEKLGFDRVVVILTRDKSYVKKPMNPKPIDLWYKHYPALAEQLKNRHNVYNNALRELLNWEQQGKAWVLHPSQPIEIGRLERRSDKLQAVYDLGTGDAQVALDSLRTYLAKS